MQECFPLTLRKIQATAQAISGAKLTFLAAGPFPIAQLAIPPLTRFTLAGLLSRLLSGLLARLARLLSGLLTRLLTLRHLLSTLLGQR